MIYVVGIRSYREGSSTCTCFDSITESLFDIAEGNLTELLENQGLIIENIKLTNSKLTFEHCFNSIHYVTSKKSSGADYILIGKIADDDFKLVDYNGKISHTWERDLIRYIKNKKVANCTINNKKVISIGTQDISKNTTLEEQIAEKYKIFTAKTALLGYKMDFKYIIEGTQVKLIKYKGKSTKVIVPKFITAIADRAFLDCRIEKLTLDKGLTHIGGFAFDGCDISELTIPDTVELICPGAFFDNKRIVRSDESYTDNVKFLNPKTIKINMIWR